MTDPAVFDVAVIGGGIAGMTAAGRAAELGKRTVVLEQGSDERYLCNSRFSGGTFHVCYTDVMADEERLVGAIEAATNGIARSDVVHAVARDGRRVVSWLRTQGIRFVKGAAAHQAWVLTPPARTGPGLTWRGRGGDVALHTLEANLRSNGGDLVRGARATSLVMKDGRCVGVDAEVDGEPRHFRAGAVVIADGGFQGDPDLVAAHVSPAPAKLRQRGAGTGVGDGLRMATAVGAKATDLKSFYGHLLSADALTNDGLWPYPYLDSVATAAILVRRDGCRFADEGRGGVYAANAVARLDDPLSAFLVFDQAIWDGPGTGGAIPPNPHLARAGGTMHTAADVGALATLVGIGADGLQTTIETFNTAVDSGDLKVLRPTRSGTPALPVRTPPFHAVPVCAGITYTMGGIATDADGRVLDRGDQPILGLYAAGATTGGLEGGEYAGYVGGLVKSATIALRAAEHIARS